MLIIKRKECKDCQQEAEYIACALKESMSHWRETGFLDRSFSHVYRCGEIRGIKTTLKTILVISIFAAVFYIAISRL